MADTGKTLAFSKVKYDATDIPPDAPAGRWNATLKIKQRTVERSSGKYPMLELQWTLKEYIGTDEETEDHTKAIGSTTFDYLGFVPKGDKWEKGCKQKNRDLCALMEVELSSLPTVFKSWADFKEYIEAMDGRTVPITTIVKERDGEKRTEVVYRKPSGEIPPIGADVEEDDEEAAGPGDEEEPEEEETEEKETEEEEEEEETEEEEEEEEEEEAPPPPPVAKKKVLAKTPAAPPVAAPAKKIKKK